MRRVSFAPDLRGYLEHSIPVAGLKLLVDSIRPKPANHRN
jgi:hypothetical protein